MSKMKNRSADNEDNDAPNVEMFLSSITSEQPPRESYKPLILPSPQVPNRASAKRRWKLLKNVTRMGAFHRSSLTQDEETLLQSISSNKSKTSDKEEPLESESHVNESPLLKSARQQLISSIHQKRMSLTAAEQSFLHSLTKASAVSVEHLEQAQQVLNNDPLYHHQSVKEEDEEKLREFEEQVGEPGELLSEQSKKRPQLNKGNDASFRTELWTQYTSNSSLLQSGQVEEEKQEKPEQAKIKTSPKKTKKSFFQFFFQKKEEEERDEHEVAAEEEAPIVFTILATSADDKDCQPHVLSPPIMDALRPYLPFCVQQDNFWLKYSMIRDGASMRCLLEHVRNSTRTVLAIETMDGDVFGSFTSSPWRPNGREYYGSGEAFLWRLSKSRFTKCDSVESQIRLEQDVAVFPWTGRNRNVQSLVNHDSYLVLGGGGTNGEDEEQQDNEKDGSGLMISSALERGWSDPCITFNSPSLVTTQDEALFEIANIEVWSLTPVESLEQAEQLELGRQFVFDHGNFVEQ